MKNIAKLLAVLLCVIVAISATACELPFDLPFDIPGITGGEKPGPGEGPGDNNTPDDPDTGWKPSGVSVDIIDAANPSKSAIVYATGLADKGKALNTLLEDAGISGVSVGPAAGNEELTIVIGRCDYKASETAKALYDAKNAENPRDYHWAYYYYDGCLAIYSNNDIGYEKALATLISQFVSGGKLTILDTLSTTMTYTQAEYKAYLAELDRIEYEANKEANKTYIEELVSKIDTQRTELNSVMGSIYKYHNNYSGDNTLMFVTHTEDLMAVGAPRWNSPSISPKEEHPRLLVNSDMYAEIRENIAAGGADAAEFKRLLEMILPNDGLLGDRIQTDVNSITGKCSDHNINYEYLHAIQAKALAYLIYDDSYYGYQAVYYMKNFLKSLDIVQMYNDQSRDYGYIMFSTAIVYDWCHDLLNETDKTQFIAGVENILCRGGNANGVKMEVGFPPSALGAVSDHACEYMLLRDYLSFAVAVYGDNDSWWNYVGGRVYSEYVPMRNYYYQSGLAPQGTGVYITARFVGDIFSAWILETATGENPYTGMEDVLRSCFSLEYTPGKYFNDGDGDKDYVDAKRFIDIAYMSAYIYGDSTALAQAQYLSNGYIVTKYHEDAKGYIGIDSPLLMALSGMSDIEPALDRYEDLDLINYNGSPLGQYVAHSAWNDPNAASIFMRIKERSTANHEHLDCGTFEIYYKGALTTDGGVYNGYGTAHTDHYHQATISHNGLLIVDPAKRGSNGGYYSGGQEPIGGTGSTLEQWNQSASTYTGKVVGYEHGYVNGDKSQPLYAYIAGDITEAYPSDSVNYVGRRMLTVFTDNEEFPMVFFVFDDISSVQGCQRTFLLQISSKNAPVIDNTKKTVTTENGDGKLVLTCLTTPASGKITINGVGGRNSGTYNASQSQNYMVNGVQIVPNSNTRDDGHWGRVELVYSSVKTDVTFMNVIYVTDKGNENAAKVVSVTKASGLEGGVFNEKIVGLFASSRTGANEALSCTTKGKGNLDYYVSGVAAGSWTVTVDGKDCGTYTATEEGGLLTFTAPAGAVVITPAN